MTKSEGRMSMCVPILAALGAAPHAGAAALSILLAVVSAAAAADSPALSHFRDEIEPILSENCFGCHGSGLNQGGVALDDFDSDRALLENRDLWWRVLKNVRSGVMPPPGEPRLPRDQQEKLDRWIKRIALGSDPRQPDPGRVTLRRLNRTEYRNTIRDLMGFDFRTEEEFPPDDTGYGFDNIGDVLSVSPLLLEKYMQAAERVVAGAVPLVSRTLPEQSLGGQKFREEGTKRTGERLTFYEPAVVSRVLKIDTAGEYRVKIELEVDGDFNFDPGRCRLLFRMGDDERLREEFGWADNRRYQFELPAAWPAGEHKLTFELQPLTAPDEKKTSVDMQILNVRVLGPLDRRHWTRSKNYERFFSRDDPPDVPLERREYARTLLSAFATRAFRRPIDAPTVDRLVSIAEAAYSRPHARFEEGIAQALIAVLASPRFLFRIEPPTSPSADIAPIDDYALASRLSYFLWSTMPDAELLRLAELGLVRERLGPQVRRMLADDRSRELNDNFVGQWLQIRDIESIPLNSRAILRREGIRNRDELLDGELRRAMRRESELVFGHIVSEDRSLLELLDGNYTFLNEKLAKHYGIPGVEGKQMRYVTLDSDSPRGGVLTQGAVLAVTSNPTRTSPVKRGLFVLDNLLATPAPPAPPDVPELEAAEKAFTDHEPTMREIMELHRQQPLCHACHSRMDPLGLALENFNALGMWRDTERGQPIDTRGQLITGEPIADIRALKHVLAHERRSEFYRCVTEKLLTYALGRGLDYNDVETVDQIADRLEREQGRASALILGIVESAAFQKRRTRTP